MGRVDHLIPGRSAIVRETFKIRSYPRADSPIRSKAFFNSCIPRSVTGQNFRIIAGVSPLLQ